jgi:hypothetical protein
MPLQWKPQRTEIPLPWRALAKPVDRRRRRVPAEVPGPPGSELSATDVLLRWPEKSRVRQL